jgi:hypothetical protein
MTVGGGQGEDIFSIPWSFFALTALADLPGLGVQGANALPAVHGVPTAVMLVPTRSVP